MAAARAAPASGAKMKTQTCSRARVLPVPFPQVVVNQPTVFKKATIAEKLAADKFNAEQKEAIRSMADEDEDFDESNDSDRR